jgi:choline dehydrogenase-like flavoprotein
VRLCIVGSGVAAVVSARAALAAGHEVVMLEAGPRVPMRDPRRWLDFATTGVRPYRQCEDSEVDINCLQGVDPARDHYHLKGSRVMAVGGSTLHWSGWTPRFQPEDFELYTRTGQGSDWPFDYAEIEPYYCQAEALLNVTGPNNPTPGHPTPWRSAPYKWDSPPYPVEVTEARKALESLGITYDHVPMSRRGPDGDGVGQPCMTFGTCRYCPMGARFDPTLLLEDLESQPGFQLLTESTALAVVLQGETARGVTYRKPDGQTARLDADVVLVAAGALETPKLLWHSGFDASRSPALGRYLTTHPMVVLETRLDNVTREFSGREVPMPGFFSRHFDTPNEQREGKVLFSDYPGEPDLQAWVRDGMDPEYIRALAREPRISLRGFVEEFPRAENRIVFEGAPGSRQTRVEYQVGPQFAPRWQWMLDKLQQVLVAAGGRASEVRSTGLVRRADHSIGTVRFGRDPGAGVVDGSHLVFGTKNLFAITNGNFPTSAAGNPTLTLTALTLRWADKVLPGLR